MSHREEEYEESKTMKEHQYSDCPRMNESIRLVLRYANDTPAVLSLLYDLDLMPEQLDVKSRDWGRMLILIEAWRQNEEFHKKASDRSGNLLND